MSQSATLDSISTTALVETVDLVKVGNITHYFVQVRYIDKVARPDLSGKLSGWLRTSHPLTAGDVVNIGFDLKSDKIGNSYYQPFIFFRGVA